MEFLNGQEKLLEPLKYYKSEFAEKFLDELTKNFEDLLKKSNIDIEANRKSVKEYNDLIKNKNKNNRKLKFLDVCSYILFLILLYLGFWDLNFIIQLKKLLDSKGNIQEIALKTALLSIVIILVLVFNF